MLNEKKLKKIIIATISIIVLIIGISVYFIIDNALKTATINIMVAPLSADVSLNGKKYTNGEEHKIKPGDYEILITKAGYFEPYTETFSIQSGETKNFYLELTAIEGTNWYQDHPEDALPLDAILDHDLITDNIYIQNNFPLLYELPIAVEYYKNGGKYVNYVISYDVNDLKNPTIIIKDYSGNNQDDALTRITNLGYDLNNYNIEYQDKTTELLPSIAPNN